MATVEAVLVGAKFVVTQTKLNFMMYKVFHGLEIQIDETQWFVVGWKIFRCVPYNVETVQIVENVIHIKQTCERKKITRALYSHIQLHGG